MTVSTNLLSVNAESVETDTGGWIAGANTSLFQSSRWYVGTKSLGMTATAAGSVTASTASRVAVTPGTAYQAYAFFTNLVATAGRTASVRINWYPTLIDGTLISSSTGAAVTMTNDTQWSAPCPQVTATAPAGANAATITITVTGLTAGAQVAADKIMVGLPTNPTTNLLPYTAASVETDTSEWTVWTNATISRSTVPTAYEGWYSLVVTSTAAGQMGVASIPVAVTAGMEYQGQVLAQSANGPLRIDLYWYDASGTQLGITTGNTWALTTGSWTRCNTVGTAPPGAVTARLAVAPTATAAGQVWNCDALRILDLSASVVPGNLVSYAQSDVEGGLPGWSVTGGTMALSTAYVYSGSYAVGGVSSGGDLTISCDVTPTSPIVPGQSYQMRVMQRTPDPTALPFVTRIEWLDSTGSAVRTRWQNWNAGGSAGWYSSPMGDIAPAGAVTVRLAVVLSGLSAGVPVYLDRLQLTVGGLTVSAMPAASAGAQLTVSGLSTNGPTWAWTLTRVDDAGTSYPVRGWAGDLTNQAVNSDVAVVTDYEAPLGVPVQWRVKITSPDGAYWRTYTSDQLTLDATDTEVWLKDPGLPQRSVAVTVAPPMPTWTRPARQSTSVVRGRALPVVISDVRGGRTGDLTVVTETAEDRDALWWVLDAGSTLLLQWPPGWGEADMYVQVGDVQAAPVVEFAEFHDRTFVLPLTEVDRPVGGVTGSADRTWQTVKDSAATWGDALADATSWLVVRVGS